MDNTDLNNANKAKKDEFYTQLEDIEKVMKHYKDFFAGKIVFCNFDDSYESNFFKFFAMNFNHLGLKKLITTCYVKSPIARKQLTIDDILSGKRNVSRSGPSWTTRKGKHTNHRVASAQCVSKRIVRRRIINSLIWMRITSSLGAKTVRPSRRIVRCCVADTTMTRELDEIMAITSILRIKRNGQSMYKNILSNF